MSPWIRHLFLSILPRLLMMRPPHQKSVNVPRTCVQTNHGTVLQHQNNDVRRNCVDAGLQPSQLPAHWVESVSMDSNCLSRYHKVSSLGISETLQPVVKHAMFGINFISEHVKQQDEFQRVTNTAVMIIISMTIIMITNV